MKHIKLCLLYVFVTFFVMALGNAQDTDLCNPWPNEAMQKLYDNVNEYIDKYPPIYKKTTLSERMYKLIGYKPEIDIELVNPVSYDNNPEKFRLFLQSEFVGFSQEETQFQIIIDDQRFGPYEIASGARCTDQCMLLQGELKTYKASYSIEEKTDYDIKPMAQACNEKVFFFADKVYVITVSIEERE